VEHSQDINRGYFFVVEEGNKIRAEIVRSEKKGIVGVIKGPRSELEERFLKNGKPGECFYPLCPDGESCPQIFGLVFGGVMGFEIWGDRLLGVYRCQCGKCVTENLFDGLRLSSERDNL
jgi:hypothetical protein